MLMSISIATCFQYELNTLIKDFIYVVDLYQVQIKLWLKVKEKITHRTLVFNGNDHYNSEDNATSKKKINISKQLR